jgi:hypothetical protein
MFPCLSITGSPAGRRPQTTLTQVYLNNQLELALCKMYLARQISEWAAQFNTQHSKLNAYVSRDLASSQSQELPPHALEVPHTGGGAVAAEAWRWEEELGTRRVEREERLVLELANGCTAGAFEEA